MGDVVDLHGQPAHLEDDHELIENLARYAEGLLSKEAVKKKHRLADSIWQQLGENDALVEAIEAEKLRRIRNGQAKRELAQKHVVKAPDVLSGIMLDANASPKHRIDSAKVLDQFAANGPQSAPAGDRFIITINLGTDVSGAEVVEHYNKSIAINADDVDPNDADAFAAITKKDNDGGQGYL
jgi:lysophospholipase L1-like esterase